MHVGHPEHLLWKREAVRGAGDSGGYIREAMFGGEFGASVIGQAITG